MRLWIHITAATILTVCDSIHGRVTVNPFNDNGSKSKENYSTSSEDNTGWNRGFNAEEFIAYVPAIYQKYFQISGRRVAFQPSEPGCMKALRWLEDTHKSNITMIEKLIIFNIHSCPEKPNAQKFCARNGIGHTRFFSDKCLKCAKGCKDVLRGGTRYISRNRNDCKEADKECKKLSCPENIICVHSENGYRCHCPTGYGGPGCNIDIDECASSPCQNGAACIDGINGYRCYCLPGYEGTTCELDVDECLSSPCQNGATCLKHINGYRCNCAPGFQGTNCKIDIYECASSPCQNGAACIDEINGYRCNCLPGYEGITCEPVCGTISAEEAVGTDGSAGTGMRFRIVGGQNAVHGSSPWIVRLYDISSRAHFCAGSIVSNWWIISTAYCIFESGVTVNTLMIRLGDYDVLRTDESESLLGVAEIIIPDGYNASTFDQDIALIRLSTPIYLFTDYIRPICLPNMTLARKLYKAGIEGKVAGWGRVEEAGPLSRYLTEVNLPLVGKTRCRASTNNTVTTNMFCAGYPRESIGACSGDTGGPFAVDFQGRWYLLGITSWGEGCGREGKYGFYTRVSNLLDWTNSYIHS